MDLIVKNAAEIRKNNKKKILSYIQTHDCVSKKEIERKTDLSSATVSNLCNQLVQEGFLSVDSKQKSSGGRNASLFTIRDNHKFYLAVRVIDERKLNVALMSFEKEILHSFDVTIQEETVEAFIDSCLCGIRKCVEAEQDATGGILGVGIALPGIMENEKECLINSTIPYLEQQPVLQKLQERLSGFSVTGANESNILALALAKRDYNDLTLQDTIYLHVDEGLGIGVICNGRLLLGSHNRGGEINHMPIGERGRLCSCGQRGCVETELSIGGILLDYSELTGRTSSWEAFCQAVREKDGNACRILEEKGRILGKLISILDSVFDPCSFYLGGQAVDLFSELSVYIDLEYQKRFRLDKSPQMAVFPCYEYNELLLKGCADLVFDEFALSEN